MLHSLFCKLSIFIYLLTNMHSQDGLTGLCFLKGKTFSLGDARLAALHRQRLAGAIFCFFRRCKAFSLASPKIGRCHLCFFAMFVYIFYFCYFVLCFCYVLLCFAIFCYFLLCFAIFCYVLQFFAIFPLYKSATCVPPPLTWPL